MQSYFIRSNAKKNCYFEIHDSQLIERFPNLVERFIFHLHGSEIRSIGLDGEIIETTTELTKLGLLHSPLIFYSTPEMKKIVQKYSERTVWMPFPINQLNLKQFNSSANSPRSIFFPNAWDTGKGALKILEAISEIQIKGTRLPYPLFGLNLGAHREVAIQMGIQLLDTVGNSKHLKRIRSSRGVVGQGYGILGVTDLEAMVLNRNYFKFSASDSWNATYEITEEERERELNSFLIEPSPMDEKTKSQILRFHSFESVRLRLNRSYNDFL
jgi:hypothetical protein